MPDCQDNIFILKIGGSSITNKAREETLNDEALDWFAKLVADSVDESFLSPIIFHENEYLKDRGTNKDSRPKFILIHGAGSFGHHSAKRYGLQCGKAVLLEELDREQPDSELDLQSSNL